MPWWCDRGTSNQSKCQLWYKASGTSTSTEPILIIIPIIIAFIMNFIKADTSWSFVIQCRSCDWNGTLSSWKGTNKICYFLLIKFEKNKLQIDSNKVSKSLNREKTLKSKSMPEDPPIL